MNQYNFVPKVCESRTIYKVKIPTLSLAPGTYSISLFLGNGISDQDVVVNAIYFDVVWSPNRKIPNPPGANWGPLLLPISWEQESELVGVSHE
jgi:lipopolysaccharide transport system ATP-binding protein